MSKLRKWILILVCGILASALVWTFLPEGEPNYKSRSLSQWLNWYWANGAGTPERRDAEQAILHIGTNAVPYLVRWISYEAPPWRKKLAWAMPQNFEAAGSLLLIRHYFATKAISGFIILGTNAASAIPDLAVLMNNTNAHMPSTRATYALCSIGDPALPVLAAALRNPNNPHRHNIPWAIAAFPPKSMTTNAWIPPLLNALVDPDPYLRASATNALKAIAPEALTNAPPQ